MDVINARICVTRINERYQRGNENLVQNYYTQISSSSFPLFATVYTHSHLKHGTLFHHEQTDIHACKRRERKVYFDISKWSLRTASSFVFHETR